MEAIRVFVRVRPDELDSPDDCCVITAPNNTSVGTGSGTGGTVSITAPPRGGDCGSGSRGGFSFEFDKVFSAHASQEEVFAGVLPVLAESSMGFDVTVFAYGMTGSGKTHTISGTYANPGILYKSVHHIFSSLQSARIGGEGGGVGNDDSNQVSISVVFLSYIELYNNSLYDLLDHQVPNDDDTSCRVKLHEHPRKGVIVTGSPTLHTPVGSVEQVMELVARGNRLRATSSTILNERSSRSHAVIMLDIETQLLHRVRDTQEGEENEDDSGVSPSPYPVAETAIRRSRVNLVDLAGSERLKLSGAEGRVRDETRHINKALTCLGDVLNALSKYYLESQHHHHPSQALEGSVPKALGHVPYRDSKLTMLLKSSLGGHAKTVMLATIRNSAAFYHQSLITLRYAARTRHIKNTPIRHVIKKPMSNASYCDSADGDGDGCLMEDRLSEIKHLRSQLCNREKECEKLRLLISGVNSQQLQDEEGDGNTNTAAELREEYEQKFEQLQKQSQADTEKLKLNLDYLIVKKTTMTSTLRSTEAKVEELLERQSSVQLQQEKADKTNAELHRKLKEGQQLISSLKTKNNELKSFVARQKEVTAALAPVAHVDEPCDERFIALAASRDKYENRCNELAEIIRVQQVTVEAQTTAVVHLHERVCALQHTCCNCFQIQKQAEYNDTISDTALRVKGDFVECINSMLTKIADCEHTVTVSMKDHTVHGHPTASRSDSESIAHSTIRSNNNLHHEHDRPTDKHGIEHSVECLLQDITSALPSLSSSSSQVTLPMRVMRQEGGGIIHSPAVMERCREMIAKYCSKYISSICILADSSTPRGGAHVPHRLYDATAAALMGQEVDQEYPPVGDTQCNRGQADKDDVSSLQSLPEIFRSALQVVARKGLTVSEHSLSVIHAEAQVEREGYKNSVAATEEAYCYEKAKWTHDLQKRTQNLSVTVAGAESAALQHTEALTCVNIDNEKVSESQKLLIINLREDLNASHLDMKRLQSELLASHQRADDLDRHRLHSLELYDDQLTKLSKSNNQKLKEMQAQLSEEVNARAELDILFAKERSKLEKLNSDASNKLDLMNTVASDTALQYEMLKEHYERQEAHRQETETRLEHELLGERRLRVELGLELQAVLGRDREHCSREAAMEEALNDVTVHSHELQSQLALVQSKNTKSLVVDLANRSIGGCEGCVCNSDTGDTRTSSNARDVLLEQHLVSSDPNIFIDPKLVELMKSQEVVMLNQLVRKTVELDLLRKELSEVKNNELTAQINHTDKILLLERTCDALREECEVQRRRDHGRLELLSTEKVKLQQQVIEFKDVLLGERSIRNALRDDISQCRQEKSLLQQKLSSLLRGQLSDQSG